MTSRPLSSRRRSGLDRVHRVSGTLALFFAANAWMLTLAEHEWVAGVGGRLLLVGSWLAWWRLA